MNPVRQITPPDWMRDDRTLRVMAALGGDLAEPEALFVGGCVRNLLLNDDAADIDIATRHHPMKVMEKLSSAGIRYVPTGLEHGTIMAVVDDMTFEITTLRKDIDTNGRHAVISFSDSWQEDAERRDFTINTLLATPKGVIFDPTGQGLADIEARKVVFVGNAEKRILEDYLRILRFFRFHARFGEGAPDADVLTACSAHADKIDLLSKERVTQEILRIMEFQTPAAALTPMFACGILPTIGKGYKAKALTRLCEFQAEYNQTKLMPRLLLTAGLDGTALNGRFVLSNDQKRQLEMLEETVHLFKRISEKKIREAIYRYGNEVAIQSYFLSAAIGGKPVHPDLIDIARYWQAPVFPVRAQALIDAGVSRGPELGRRLKDMEEAWIASDFKKIPKI